MYKFVLVLNNTHVHAVHCGESKSNGRMTAEIILGML